VLRGGARGLEILSLVECRKITDQGLVYLRKLKRLKEVNLLGCYSITDGGIEKVATHCLYLTSINLSGTYITRQGLEHLKRNCKFLETVVLNGCQMLSSADNIFNDAIDVAMEEDIIRFQLIPHRKTAL
jgi:hypothetical protein